MIKVKLEINKNRKIIFKVKVDEKDRNNIFFKRAIIEGKPLKRVQDIIMKFLLDFLYLYVVMWEKIN